MEFLCELIFEVFLEGVFGLTIKNPKAKTWFKTVIWLLLAESIPILVGILSVSLYRSGDISGSITGIAISVPLGIGFLFGAIYGHKRNWKQWDED